MLTKYEIYRMRGSHQQIKLIGEHGSQSFVEFIGKRKKLKWVNTADIMMTLPAKNRWMRPWVDGDVCYSFFRWFFGSKVERALMRTFLILSIAYITFQTLRYVFDLS